MPQFAWRKSSYSAGGEGACVEVSPTPTHHIRLRESDRPRTVIATTQPAWASLLDSIKGGRLRA
ncbi:hypothetical protein FHS39_000715 [Streptomyces olivoverticillatus]|uniref:DUF397 domain-containing protein n=1 Tax=Streptomyces olivoverticillatus TaxID=66427 RepID=A0A7W7LK49_9ACTN|nr:DUF397 domain-containing protein [Streptomyces olivoverticillatus]MBB4891715.1 hypothetical protein [Streptomyces olivoverticillatus]